MQPARSAAPVQTVVHTPPAVHLSTAVPTMALPAAATCGCGHVRRAHEHYRRGSDCAFCDCARYRRPLLRRLARFAR